MRVFLYLDPYGITAIKDIPYSKLVAQYPESEVLINLNSFAFIREACRVMKAIFREGEDFVLGELDEYEPSILKSTEELNVIAGGEYWRPIITSYKRGDIDCYVAEQQFSSGFKKRLRNHFKYVLDMPIRLKSSHKPKYRMVHATNHPDGCILMADNMVKRSDYLVMNIQNRGQLSFLEQSVENELISDEMLKEKVKESLQNNPEYVNLGDFLAEFYDEHGVICGLSKLSSGNRSVLKIMEEERYIEVIRNPEQTPTGRKSGFWQETNEKKIYLRKRAK